LIVQLLDKLVDNAVDFSVAGTLIEIALEVEEESCALSVVNEGQPLPEEVRRRLFESIFRQRQDSPGQPHFGLGLYIVRLIAEFHGGSVFAENLSGAVQVGVRMECR
jgi:signal transduction histidine kinase